MAVDVRRTLDFNNVARIINLPDGVDPQEPATVAQLNASVEGLKWKVSARVATQGNLNLASPGATIDGVTMVASDRVLVYQQTAPAENGIYIWNGAATPMTRSADASTATELESATISVEEGTDANATFRQTAVNFTLETDDVTFGSFGTSAPSASESAAGLVELATQGETDTGTDDARAITPLKLATSPWAKRKHAANFGDGSSTSFVITHNFNTYDVQVEVFRNSGNRDSVLAEVRRTGLNEVTIVTDAAVASDALRAVVVA